MNEQLMQALQAALQRYKTDGMNRAPQSGQRMMPEFYTNQLPPQPNMQSASPEMADRLRQMMGNAQQFKNQRMGGLGSVASAAQANPTMADMLRQQMARAQTMKAAQPMAQPRQMTDALRQQMVRAQPQPQPQQMSREDMLRRAMGY